MNIEKTKSWIFQCLEEKNSSAYIQSLEIETKELTSDFLQDLRCIFEHYLKAFDEIKVEGVDNQKKPIIKESLKNSLFIYDLADNEGFMLFKKSFKLIVSYVKPGEIRIKFLKQKIFSQVEVLVDVYLHLVYNEMMSVNWVHENKKGFVDKNVLARFYMKRFLQAE